MSTVLWGGRRGDVYYGSRDYWRRNCHIGHMRMTLQTAAYFDVGDWFETPRKHLRAKVTGKQ